MIALLIADRCTGCNRCAEVCPANVFDTTPSGPPIIARAEDCHTCFQCELYCRADALYVEPNRTRVVAVTEDEARATGTLGRFRRHSGWDEWADAYPNEQWVMETVFRRAAESSKR